MSRPNSRDVGRVIHKGRVLEGEEFREFARSRGLCQICGLFQTHEIRKTRFRLGKPELVPIQERRNEDNVITVYKGYCIQPTCYTLNEVAGKTRTVNRNRQSRKSTTITVADLQSDTDKSSSTDQSRYSTLSEESVLSPGFERSEPFLPARSPKDRVPFQGHDFRGPTTSNSDQLTRTTITSLPSDMNNSNVGKLRKSTGRQDLRSTEIQTATEALRNPTRNTRYRSLRMESSDGKDNLGLSSTDPRSSSRNSSGNNNNNNTSRLSVQRITSVVNENSGDTAIHELKDMVSYENYIEFLAKLAQYQSQREVVKVTFQLLCNGIHKAQKIEGKRDVFQNDGWVKSLLDAAQEHRNDVDIQMFLCGTFTLLSMISVRYLSDIVRQGGPLYILKVMEKFPQNRECIDACCSALFACTSTNNKQAGIMIDKRLGKRTLRALASAIEVTSISGTFSALSAFVNFERQNVSARNSVFTLLRGALPGRDGIEALALAIMSDQPASGVTAVGLELLYIFSGNREAGHPIFTSTTKLLSWVVETVNNTTDASLLKTGYGLIANLCLSLQDANVANLNECWTVEFFTSMVGNLTAHVGNEELQINAMEMLLNIGEVAYMKAAFLSGVVIQVMEAHIARAEVVSVGCLVLTAFSATGEDAKLTIVRTGGLGVVEKSFQSVVIESKSSNLTLANKRPSSAFAAAACTLVASLLLSPAVLDEVKKTALLSMCRSLLERKGDIDVAEAVRSNIVGICSRLQTDGPSAVKHAIDGIMQSQGMGATESSMASIQRHISTSPGAVNSFLSASNGRCLHRVVALMSTFVTSVDVQLHGCVILATVYSAFPCNGQIPNRTRVDPGHPGHVLVYVQTHTENELAVLRQALQNHRTNAGIVTAAILALSHFLNDFSREQCISSKCTQLRRLLRDGLRDCNDILSVHRHNEGLVSITIALLRLMSLLTDEDALNMWCPLLLATLAGLLSEFSGDEQVSASLLEVLLGLIERVSTDDSIASLTTDGTIRMMLGFLNSYVPTTAEVAATLLDSLAKRLVATVVSRIMHVQGSLQSIVNCIKRHIANPAIVSSCCSLLASIAVMQDSFVQRQFALSGGLFSIIEAIRSHPQDVLVQRSSCRALSTISKGIPAGLLAELDTQICETLSGVLCSNLTDEQVISSLLETLWCICTREESFKKYFGRPTRVTSIVQSMSMHLLNRSIQTAGCSCLWTLSSFGKNKDIIGGCGGLHAIINALMAHLDSPSIQKEALVALKNLATTTGNKRTIRSYMGEKAILLSMRYNVREETILTAAFSALNNIAVDTATREVQVVSPGTLNCVLDAMMRFPESRSLQHSAVFLLKSYSYSRPNTERMAERRMEFIQCLNFAMNCYPECRERAEYVLMKL